MKKELPLNNESTDHSRCYLTRLFFELLKLHKLFSRQKSEHNNQAKKIIKDLYLLLGLERYWDESLTAKKLKASLMWIKDLVGFEGTPDFNRNNPFEVKGRNRKKLTELINRLANEGKVLHIRILTGDKGSGNPMCYILRPEHIQHIIYNRKGIISGFIDTDGKRIKLKNGMHLDIFEQDPSDEFEMAGFPELIDGKTINAKLGGGLRIEIDDMAISFYTDVNGNTRKAIEITAAVNSVFEDMGPRGTAKEDKFSKELPKLDIKIKILLINGKLEVKNCVGLSESEILNNIALAIKNKDINLYLNFLIGYLFHKEGTALATLFIAVLKIQPILRRHSVECVFSTRYCKDTGIISILHKFTSLDGIDTIWSSDKDLSADEIKWLKQVQECKELLFQVNHQAELTCNFNAPIKPKLDQVLELLPTDIHEDVKEYYRDFNTMKPERKGTARILGRVFEQINIKWTETEDPNLFTYVTEDMDGNIHILYKINIGGFDLVYWFENNELKEFENGPTYYLKNHSASISEIFNCDFRPAHVNYSVPE